MEWVLMIIALLVFLLLLLGLSLGKSARHGDDMAESALRDLAKKDYYLWQLIDDAKGIREFSDEEYHAYQEARASRTLMHIRDLKWNRLRMWPPEFGLSNQIVGEKGILKSVQIRHDLKINVIIVTASYLDKERKGIIILEDPLRLQILCNKLKENIGKPFCEIGDMEIDFYLSVSKKEPKQVRPRTEPETTIKKSNIQ
jgi:hypothetical protein